MSDRFFALIMIVCNETKTSANIDIKMKRFISEDSVIVVSDHVSLLSKL